MIITNIPGSAGLVGSHSIITAQSLRLSKNFPARRNKQDDFIGCLSAFEKLFKPNRQSHSLSPKIYHRSILQMTTWLVTGASRGLGLGLVKEILGASKQNIVFAACRDPSNAKQLTDLASASDTKNLYIVKLNVTDEKSIEEASKEVGAILTQKGLPLDYLINNAGVTSGNDSPLSLKAENFVKTLLTNAVAPIIVSQQFMPLLEKSKRPVLMNMTSSLGSIEMADSTYQTSYCASKSALNMLTRKLATEKRNVIAFVMDPGWVRTDLGGPSADLDIEFSVSSMYKTISNVSEKDSGSFLKFDGRALPW